MSVLYRVNNKEPYLHPTQAFADDATCNLISGYAVITAATQKTLTINPPTNGLHDGAALTILCTGNAAHVVAFATDTDGFGGGANDTCTFTGAGDYIRLLAFGGNWHVVDNLNGTLSDSS